MLSGKSELLKFDQLDLTHISYAHFVIIFNSWWVKILFYFFYLEIF